MINKKNPVVLVISIIVSILSVLAAIPVLFVVSLAGVFGSAGSGLTFLRISVWGIALVSLLILPQTILWRVYIKGAIKDKIFYALMTAVSLSLLVVILVGAIY